MTFATQEINTTCHICKSYPGHGLAYCDEFGKLMLTKRAEQVARLKNCLHCLSRYHFSSNFRKETYCNVDGCQRRHHHLLHGTARITPRVYTNTEVSRQFSVNATCDTRRIVLLQVIPILVYGRGKWVKTFALLDSASEATLITVEFARKFGLKEKDSRLTLGSWHGHDPDIQATATNFTIAA